MAGKRTLEGAGGEGVEEIDGLGLGGSSDQNKLAKKVGWRTNHAGLNEDCGLELSGVGKPPDSSRTSGSSEVGGCGYFVLVGDEA
jgi:hypothetical protein